MFADLTHNILRKRSHAILAVLVSSLLPFGTWLGAITLSLVTLRKGIQDGFIILLWCALPSVVLTYFYGFWVAWESIVLGFALLWIMSVLLRVTMDWSTVMNTAVAVGLLSIVGFYAWFGNPQQYWIEHLIPVYQRMLDMSQLTLSHTELMTIARETAECLTGLQVTLLLLLDVIYLVFARGLQASVFNPGGLQNELLNIHIPLPVTLLWVSVWILAKTQTDMALDFLPVILLPFCLTGISLVHRLRMYLQIKRQWLVVFYLMLILFLPYMAMGLVGIAVLDSVMDFRKRRFNFKGV